MFTVATVAAMVFAVCFGYAVDRYGKARKSDGHFGFTS